MAIGRLLAAIKSFPESLKVIGFPKNKDVGGTWDKSGSFNERQRNFNNFFALNEHVNGHK